MPKFLTHIFGHKPTSNNVPSTAIGSTNGRLETDAAPVEDDDESNANNNLQQPITAIATPTASADMTADMVRELSDPNYNSLDLVPGGSSALATTNTNNSMSTSNTMNVHNAQQQLVMQFSNVSQLHVGSVYNFNSNLSATNSRKSSNTDEASAAAVAKGFSGSVAGDGLRQTTRKTTSVVAMMQSQEEPNHRILDAVATHLGEGWRFVMRELGHSEGQIEQAIIDHQMHGGIKEVIYQLLLQWVRNADDGKATVACITSLLWEMNHRECVQRMKLVWKSNSKSKPFR